VIQPSDCEVSDYSKLTVIAAIKVTVPPTIQFTLDFINPPFGLVDVPVPVPVPVGTPVLLTTLTPVLLSDDTEPVLLTLKTTVTFEDGVVVFVGKVVFEVTEVEFVELKIGTLVRL